MFSPIQRIAKTCDHSIYYTVINLNININIKPITITITITIAMKKSIIKTIQNTKYKTKNKTLKNQSIFF